MLAKSDVDIEQFFHIFAETGVPVAFLVPTPTGYEKSIMDATGPVRTLLKDSRVHNYIEQKQGQDAKVIIESYFVYPNKLIETSASLYRPLTKKGDPRIWFKGLKNYCNACNLLALIIVDKKIYVINLSAENNAKSLKGREYVYDLLVAATHSEKSVADELRGKIQKIHDQGFIPSVTVGDPGVGDTLEHALGIMRNNSKTPDYKGIELKATRLTRNGTSRPATRSTLFTKVPDEGMSYREIVDNYGKRQVPRGETEERLQLYETLRASRANAYDLILEIEENHDLLKIMHQEDRLKKYVSAWYLSALCETLRTKHHETFWVKAVSENINGKEFFRYDKILHTRNPNTSLIVPLIEADKITIDLAAHYKPDGKWRDHGMLFKMAPKDLPLLLGNPIEYDLT